MKDERLEREKSRVICKHLRTHDSLVTGIDNPISLDTVFYVLESGETVCQFTPKAYHTGHDNMMHGGLISAVLDETMGRANIVPSMVTRSSTVVTGEFSVRFINPIFIDEKITCVAKRIRKDGRQNFCEGWLIDEDGIIRAKATGIFVDVVLNDDISKVLDIEGNTIYIDSKDPKELLK